MSNTGRPVKLTSVIYKRVRIMFRKVCLVLLCAVFASPLAAVAQELKSSVSGFKL